MMKRSAAGSLTSLSLMLAGLLAGSESASADLFEYVKKPDPTFLWRQIGNDTTEQGKLYTFEFTSQTWRGIPWSHQLRIYEPAELVHPKLMLLFITGGSSDSKVKPDDHVQGFALAKACGSCVAVLPQVPNQPLMGGKKEDDLIGETFVHYIKTQEADWPLLFPMVKSAVRAMDALQEWGRERRTPIEGFVVTGESKRGWTTWLTGAVDPRVVAIAPMVIPTLNMKAQTAYQKASWGQFSEQIEDYTRRGLTEKFEDPVGKTLWKMVDPYSYLDRIQVPILQINGTNDRYWTLDSLNVYWNDIKSPNSYVVYLPNAGHGLEQNREWAINGIGALVRHVAKDAPGPRFLHTVSTMPGEDGLTAEFGIEFQGPPDGLSSVRFWTASSPTRDFREATWTVHGEPIPTRPTTASVMTKLKVAGDGYTAIFGDLTCTIDGLEYHLSTPIAIFDAKGEVKPDLDALLEAPTPGQ